MDKIEKAIGTLGIPGSIAVVLILIFAFLQLIGEFVEVSGKVAPAAFKIRKVIREKLKQSKEHRQTLKDVKTLLDDVNNHYNADNIKKRDEWMQWVNNRAQVYDDTIVELRSALTEITTALNNNTRMTEKMFVESSRDRIISFASKVSDPLCFVSREEFNRIFRVYNEYESFLEEHNMTNGEVNLSMEIIRESYSRHLAAHNFTEDLRNN